ncbi:pyridoxamine 5'-phosphate oxidase family protein [Streptomyces sp. XD-27]|uniref:pyridoxamine 5'-phosphate oxidase family protein n=1 Tax=Streptomyces sp. XD-27 TaxID=3062779 RepID=UPI0026F45987|nr:pyridoxamine 5'-phosphate oxidase family protein [Streptomyces sp. XD-27]WKX69390.1 pyridoxamine 5'-phosphate oxidase family protein [Streptomyces sp. XD-27]
MTGSPSPSPSPSPYGPGERAVQRRAGVIAQADHSGLAIGNGIRDVAAAFLGLQPMLVIGAADQGGQVWSSLLTGPPGFVTATGPHSIGITGRVHPGDPLASTLAKGPTSIGTIALDPRTRRRMRLNGTARPSARGLAVEARQVFSNCPKYLQKRLLEEAVPGRAPGAVRRAAVLSEAQTDAIRTADTFFIATVSAGDGAAATSGPADASHRGGLPGFVTVVSPTRLSWPDYPGNAMFLTLGNLEADPRAGLLFVDWVSGDTLQLTGTARTEFSESGRTVHFALDEVAWTPAASPLRWSAPEYSPAHPPLRGA